VAGDLAVGNRKEFSSEKRRVEETRSWAGAWEKRRKRKESIIRVSGESYDGMGCVSEKKDTTGKNHNGRKKKGRGKNLGTGFCKRIKGNKASSPKG